MELRRNENQRHAYDIKRNADIQPVNLKKPCTFGNSFSNYRRTCDVQKDIKVYDFAADKQNGEQLNPSIDITKRKWPGFSQGKARQFTLWDKEVKRAAL